jgi:hypothetical protein
LIIAESRNGYSYVMNKILTNLKFILLLMAKQFFYGKACKLSGIFWDPIFSNKSTYKLDSKSLATTNFNQFGKPGNMS